MEFDVVEITPSLVSNEIKRAINNAGKLAGMPFGAGLLITSKAGEISFVGSDGQVQVKTKAALEKTESEFSVIVDARKFGSIISSFNADMPIAITQDAQRMNIESGRTKFRASCIDGGNFQFINTAGDINSKTFSLKQSDLHKMLTAVINSAADSDVRVFMMGVRFEIKDNVLNCVATNGHILSVTECHVDFDGEYQATIPTRCIQQLVRNINQTGDDLIEVIAGDTWVSFSFGNVEIVTHLHSGNYPSWRRVVPPKSESAYFVESEKFILALKRVKANADEKRAAIPVRLRIKGNEIVINDAIEDSSDQVEIETFGTPVPVQGAWNVEYLIELFDAVKAPKTKLSMQPSETAPVMLEIADYYNYRAVAMKMRI